MDLGLENAAVIVTGGASNIGRGIVHVLAAEGARLAIVDRDPARAEATASEARARGAKQVLVVAADVTDLAATEAAVGAALHAFGAIDVLVANVGWNKPAFFLDTPPETWPSILDLNLTACLNAVRAVLPQMCEQRRGAIIATASTAAFGEPRQSVYASAKAGVIAFIKTLAQEYGRYGIRANAVAPGLVIPQSDAIGAGSLWQDTKQIMNDEQIEYVRRGTPLRRLSLAEDIANAVAFLASERASRQVTGQVITVAGGFAMH
jgi:2-hydroxycyclohexanecarboxyl-CoA dehydrogenase